MASASTIPTTRAPCIGRDYRVPWYIDLDRRDSTMDYEFSAAENGVIDKLARRLRLAGILQAVVGALMLMGFASRTVALRHSSAVLTFGVDVPIAAATIAAGVLMALA